MSSNCTWAGTKSTSEIKYFLPRLEEQVTAEYFQSFSCSIREERLCGKHSQDDWSSLIFCLLVKTSSIYVRLLTPDNASNHFPLSSINFSAPNRKYNYTSLQFALTSINILKSSLIQIKSLQHFLQHRYVLLWKLLKCHKYKSLKLCCIRITLIFLISLF